MRTALSLALAAAVTAGIGCSPPTQGIVTGAARVIPGAVAPDIAFNLPDGGQGTLNKTRLAVAVVAFTAPLNDNCCQLDPRLEFLALQLADLPVSVVQITDLGLPVRAGFVADVQSGQPPDSCPVGQFERRLDPLRPAQDRHSLPAG